MPTRDSNNEGDTPKVLREENKHEAQIEKSVDAGRHPETGQQSEELEQAYQNTLRLALDVFNNKLLQENKKPLTVKDIQDTPNLNMSVRIDTGGGQSYSLVIDRSPNDADKRAKDFSIEPRIALFDHSGKGNRLFSDTDNRDPRLEVVNQHNRTVREMLDFVRRNRVRLEPGLSVKDLIHEGHRV